MFVLRRKDVLFEHPSLDNVAHLAARVHDKSVPKSLKAEAYIGTGKHSSQLHGKLPRCPVVVKSIIKRQFVEISRKWSEIKVQACASY